MDLYIICASLLTVSITLFYYILIITSAYTPNSYHLYKVVEPVDMAGSPRDML